MTTQEFDLLEFVERLEEGESIEELGLPAGMFAKCLAYENQCTGRYHGPQGYMTGHSMRHHYPQHTASSAYVFESIIPSVETEGYDDDAASRAAKEQINKPSLHPVETLVTPPNFSTLPFRTAKGLAAHPFGPALNTFKPSAPVLDQSIKHESLDVGKMRSFIEVMDLTGGEDHMHSKVPEQQQSFAHGGHQPATPRIRLTAAGLAQKRLRDPEASPFGKSVDRKRQKLITDYTKSDVQKETLSEIQKFRSDAVIVGKALSEEAVYSDEDYAEDDDDENDNGGFRISSV